MDAVITISLLDVAGDAVTGTVTIYTSSEVVGRYVSNAEGRVSALLVEGDEYTVQADVGGGQLVETVTILAEQGAHFVLRAEPLDILPTHGLCTVYGRLTSPAGVGTDRLHMRAVIVSGDVATQGDVILNDSARVRANADGYIQIGLYRGREYRVTFTGMDEYAAFDTYLVSVPDRATAKLGDLLFPVALQINTETAPVVAGDHVMSVLMSDGRTLTAYADVNLYVSVEAEGDVLCSLVSVDSRAVLRLSGDMSDWSVRVYARTEQFTRNPDIWNTSSRRAQRVLASYP